MRRIEFVQAVLASVGLLAGCGDDSAGRGADQGTSLGSTGGADTTPTASTSPTADSSDTGMTGAVADMGVPVGPTCDAAQDTTALQLLGMGAGVGMGPAPGLGLATFTLEAWIFRDGYGTTASSGVGGIVGEPLVAKGRGESDGSNVDCNYIMAIDAQGRVVADFEDAAAGLNHPIIGATSIAASSWHHVAAAYDGTTWRLFVDGVQDASVAVGAAPRADSIGHFGIGAAYDSMGIAAGSFDGRIDDVRVWSRALGEVELQAGMFGPPADATGLVSYWPLDEAPGTTVVDLVGGHDGESTGVAWSTDARPARSSVRPAAPVVVGPMLSSPAAQTALEVGTFDVDGDEMAVEFFGRIRPELERFSVVVLPDTQYFCEESHGGVAEMFYEQTQWIVENAELYDIRAVLHVGDLVNNGHQSVDEWLVGQSALETLEQRMPEYPWGIPYGIAIGNHDQAENSLPGETAFYNMYFGVDRFTGRDYYGGHFGEHNDASYLTFVSGELKFLAVFFEYDQPGEPVGNDGPDPEVLAWARGVVAAHPDHLVIAVGHSCMPGTGPGSGVPTVDTPFSTQGRIRWETLRGEPNLRLMVCGHVEDEGRRTDVAASTVHTLLSDYQFDDFGGSGKLRLMTFDPGQGELEVRTYSPYFDQWYETDDAHFVLPIDLDGGGGEFELIGTVEHVAPGESASVAWPELVAGARYEWFAQADDCTHTTVGERSFFVAR